MILQIVLVLAIIFTKNKARQIHFADALAQDEVHKAAAQLAKLIHLVSGYADLESGTLELDEDLTEEDEVRTEEEGRAETASDLQTFDLDYFLVSKDKPHVRIKTSRSQGKHQVYLIPGSRPNLAYQSPGGRPHQTYHNSSVRQHQGSQSSGVRPSQSYKGPGNKPNEAYQDPRVSRPNQAQNPEVELQQGSPVSRPYHPYQNTKARLHMIRNPRVLEEYQKKFRQPIKLYQYSEEDDYTSTKPEKPMLDQRRNAVFRLGSSIEDAPRSTKKDDFKIKHNVSKLLKDMNKRGQDIDLDAKHAVDIILVDDDNRKNGREDDSLKQENAWDVITKKYDWNDKLSNEYDDTLRHKKEKVKKSKFGDNWKNKVIKQDFNDKDTKITRPDTLDDWPSKEKQGKPLKLDSTQRKPKIKKDFDNSYEKPRREKQNTDRDVKAFNSIPQTTNRWKQEINNDWNNKVSKPDKDDWDHKIIKPDTFDDWPKNERKDKKHKWDSTERKPKIKKHFDNSYETPRKEKQNTDWDVTAFKLLIPKTTKKWTQEKNYDWDKAFAPKIYSHKNPRNKKQRASYDSGFGRTPIPYVGRQGIYVDN